MARKDSPQSAAPKKAGRFGRKKGATDATEKSGRFAQIRQVYTAARGVDPMIGWWMTVLSVRAKRAAYKSIEGQPGASGAALSSLRKGWFFEQQPVAAEAGRAGDMSSAAMVFRATGRPGVILVVEGPEARATKLGEAERKKVSRVAGPNVPVTVIRVGESGGEDEVSVRKVAGKLQRMKPVLTKEEVAAVNKRLKALGGLRPPLPAGVDPNRVRMDRKAMRGR